MELADRPEQIKPHLLRLEVKVRDAENTVRPVLDPKSWVAHEGVKLSVATELAEYPLVIEATLTANPGRRPAIQLVYKWKHQGFDHGRLVTGQFRGLSVSQVNNHRTDIEQQVKDQSDRNGRKGWVDPLKRSKDALEQAKRDLASARAELAKDGADEQKLKDEVDKCEKNVKQKEQDVNAVMNFYRQEPSRCQRLVKLLPALAARIHLRVYYQLGDGDGQAVQVTLAETAQK